MLQPNPPHSFIILPIIEADSPSLRTEKNKHNPAKKKKNRKAEG